MRFLDKKIPTLLVVLVLIAGVIVTSILVQKKVIIFQNAAPSENPQNLRITNITDNSFTVTYTTDANVVGSVSLIGSDGKTQIILDDRDQPNGTPNPYNVHSISAKELSASSRYTFSILSGSTNYINGDKPFSINTAETLSTNPTQQIPLAGKILLPDGSKPTEALIIVTTDNGQFLSTLLNPAGLYVLPLNTMRTKDLASFLTFSATSKLQIVALNSTLTSNVVVGVDSLNPVPSITLSQDYDFTLASTPLATGSASVNFPVLSFTSGTLVATPQIITPQNNQSFTDQQPQFKGTAAPNTTVTISIHSDMSSTQVTTDSNGNWVYRPNTPIVPGSHTITVTTSDQYGILHTITQNFTVYAQGTQVNQPATPSATLVQPTPTQSVAINTPPPTLNLQPTLTPSPTITTTTFSISPKPSIPPTGSNTIVIASVAGFATTVIGIVLFLVTGGISL